MITLGIESSCDDTAVAITDGARILAERSVTQTAEHEKFGGVVPEIASRAHLMAVDALAAGAMADAGLEPREVELFAAGAGPGLVGGLVVGLSLAKALALACKRPFVAVNHLEAHALMPGMFADIPSPYLLLLVSGGHSQILRVDGAGKYTMLGTTLDDACGECFDKVAKMLGFPYMGGREIERLAKSGNPRAFDFPRPLLHSGDLNFSFSGLKTAVRIKVEKGGGKEDIAASFQATAVEILAAKMRAAALAHPDCKAIVASGGVAANASVRAVLESIGKPCFFAPPKYCTDNGVMIARAGELTYAAGRRSGFDASPRPRWPLEEL